MIRSMIIATFVTITSLATLSENASADLVVRNNTNEPIQIACVTTFGRRHIYSQGYHTIEPGRAYSIKHGTDRTKVFWLFVRGRNSQRKYVSNPQRGATALVQPTIFSLPRKAHRFEIHNNHFVASQMIDGNWQAFQNMAQTGATVNVNGSRIAPSNDNQSMTVTVHANGALEFRG